MKANTSASDSSFNNEYTYLVNFKNNWQNIENELNSLNEKVKMTQTDISSLQAERSNLGFFAMKRKKEIDEKISALNAEQQSLKGFVLTVEKKKRGYSNATEVDNKINSVLREIDEQKKLIEKINVSRTSQTVREELSKFDLGKKLLNYANLDFDSAWRWINVKKGD